MTTRDALLDDLLADPVDDDPVVARARALADDVLAPAAADVDRGEVPCEHLAAIGAAGLLGLEAPASAGGLDAVPAVRRRVTELLAGADLATWFVQVQHHSPVRSVAAAGPRLGATLAELAAGRLVAGIAFSHLRHWPRRPVTATAVGGGAWRFDGVAPWYTGWGLNDVALVSAASVGGDAVHALLPARPAPGLRASQPMDVAALRAARTVTLTFDAFPVAPADVVSVEPITEWSAQDAERSANANPAVFGVAASALRLLDAEGERRGEPAAREAALRIAAAWQDVRLHAYALADRTLPETDSHQAVTAARLDLRARAHQVLVDATTALVVAGAGPSMALTAPAQRKAREALFLLVQAQTVASRTANLEVIGRAPR